MKKKRVKICFAASSGGHYEQLMMLKPLIDKYESIILTEKTLYRTSETDKKMYYLHQVNRKEKLFMIFMFFNLIKSILILIKERPNLVITTGALAMIPISLLVKISGGKLIYIESFAKVTSANATGKFLYRFADRFYVQWKQMEKIYPNATCLGGIY